MKSQFKEHLMLISCWKKWSIFDTFINDCLRPAAFMDLPLYFSIIFYAFNLPRWSLKGTVWVFKHRLGVTSYVHRTYSLLKFQLRISDSAHLNIREEQLRILWICWQMRWREQSRCSSVHWICAVHLHSSTQGWSKTWTTAGLLFRSEF